MRYDDSFGIMCVAVILAITIWWVGTEIMNVIWECIQ